MSDTQYHQFKLRLPKELFERLEKASDQASRSVSAELVSRIEASFDPKSAANAYVRGVGDGVLHAFDALIKKPVDEKAFDDIVERLRFVSANGTLPPIKRIEEFPIDLANLSEPFKTEFDSQPKRKGARSHK